MQGSDQRSGHIVHMDVVAHHARVVPAQEFLTGAQAFEPVLHHALRLVVRATAAIDVRGAEHQRLDARRARQREQVMLGAELRGTVGGERQQRMVLGDRAPARLAVHRAAGGDEHDSLHARRDGRLEQADAARHIHVQVLQRVALRFRRHRGPRRVHQRLALAHRFHELPVIKAGQRHRLRIGMLGEHPSRGIFAGGEGEHRDRPARDPIALGRIQEAAPNEAAGSGDRDAHHIGMSGRGVHHRSCRAIVTMPTAPLRSFAEWRPPPFPD
jgi:hypothetical protein